MALYGRDPETGQVGYFDPHTIPLPPAPDGGWPFDEAAAAAFDTRLNGPIPGEP